MLICLPGCWWLRICLSRHLYIDWAVPLRCLNRTQNTVKWREAGHAAVMRQLDIVHNTFDVVGYYTSHPNAGNHPTEEGP